MPCHAIMRRAPRPPVPRLGGQYIHTPIPVGENRGPARTHARTGHGVAERSFAGGPVPAPARQAFPIPGSGGTACRAHR